MSSQSRKTIFSRSILLTLLAVTTLLITLSGYLVRSSLAQQSVSESKTSRNEGSSGAQISDHYGKLPLTFEANEGQTDRQVKFLSRGAGYDLFLTSAEVVLTLRKAQPPAFDKFKSSPASSELSSTPAEQVSVLHLRMIGANPNTRVEGQDELPGKINYLVGDDQNKWHTNIPIYRKVHYAEIYPKVDLVYYGNRTELEYDFIVAPGGNLQAIKFHLEGTDRITLDHAGNLLFNVREREVRLRKPVIYQLTDKGDRREVKGDYVLKGSEIGFKVTSFDSSKPLIIDPVLSYSTLLGSGSNEFGYGIAVDSQGNSYITGATSSSLFPTTPGALQTTSVSGGAFVTKLNPTGTSLVYSTYLGGSNGNGSTTGTAIAVDLSGNAYLTGSTTAPDFPSFNAIRGSYNFLKSADSSASWTGQNFNPPRTINALAIDPQTPSTIYAGTSGGTGVYKSIDNGNSWIALNTGLTGAFVVALVVDPITPSTIYAATNAPTFGLIKSTNGGTSWISPGGLSGTGGIYSLAIDPISPSTLYLGSNGGLFKTTNGGNNWTLSNNGLGTTAFAIAIDPSTPATIYAGGGVIFKSTNGGANWSNSSTGLSGTTHCIVIDPANTATIYAGTSSGVFKSINGGGNWTSSSSGLGNAVIYSCAISPASSTTIYAGSGNGKIFKTLDGGSSWSPSYATLASVAIQTIVIDPSAPANVYAGTFSNFSPFDSEAFLAKLNDAGSALVYSTFLGGSGADFGYGIAIDSSGNAYVTGQTSSTDFLTASPFQAAPGGSNDAFLAKINSSGSMLLYSTYLGGSNSDTGYAVAVDASGNAYVTGTTTSTNFPTASAFQSTIGSTFTGDAFAAKFGTNGALAYSTYLGGNVSDVGYAIAVDSSGNAYITGLTGSSNFPTLNPIQPSNGGSTGDAFVTKLNNLGSGLVYSTYLGGSNNDSGRGITVDLLGSAYVTGYTSSAEFPVIAGALKTRSPFFTSSDSGGNWNNENFGLKSDIATVLILDPTNPSTIYAGTRSGVYKSTDGGRSWNSSSNGLIKPSVTSLVIDPATPSTIYAGVSQTDFNNSSGVYKSTDGGNTWNAVNNGLSNTNLLSLAIDPTTPSTLFAGVYGNGIFKSVNGGATWTIQGSQTVSFIDAIAVDPSTPATIYAAGNISNGGVFKSTNGGVTWQGVNNGLTTTFILSLAIDPSTPSTIYAGANGGLFRSVNGGGSWSAINSGLTSLFINGITIDPVTPATLYAASSSLSGGIFKSINGGNNWIPVNTGLPYRFASSVIVNPITPARVYAGVNVYPPDDDAFVAKLNPSGTALIYSTLLGGSPGDDEGNAIAIDSSGKAYLTGQSGSPGFPVSSDSYQPFNRGFSDVFVAKLTMSYIISGQVLDGSNAPVSGAEVTLSDGASLSSIITESDGSYQFSHLREGGDFTVSAAKPHFTMAPTSQTFNNLSSNQTLNFIATATNAPFYTISGQVTDNGVGLAGVKVTLSGSQSGVRTTDGTGNYSFTLAGGGDYTLTPAILAFTFSPVNQTFNNLGGDQTADFAATRQSFVVTNTNNHGAGSLRQAILDANATAGLDNITFNIPGPGVQTINLLVALPGITDPVAIDATTQPGFAGSPLIELNGASAGSGANGFMITGGGCTIRGFAINRFNNAGIALSINGNNVIQGNYLGIDPTGVFGRANTAGINVFQSNNNFIGGTTSGARNVISANTFYGIIMNGSANLIEGNFIGTNATGTAALASGTDGVQIFSVVESVSTNNVVGGTAPGAGNLISGNQRGIYNSAPNTSIQGNRIGTDLTGTIGIPNGIGIQSISANALIGGTVPGARNVISGNSAGVYISGPQSRLQGNFIGTDITGTLALGNTSGGVFAGDHALIGGTSPEARNIISGNAELSNGGIGNLVLDYNISGDTVTVQGNYIGPDFTGSVALSTFSTGIAVAGSRNVIGGTAPGARNIIAGNFVGIQLGGYASGVTANVVQGNFIGLNAAGDAPLPNQSDGVRIADGFTNTIGGTGADASNSISFNGGSGVSVSSSATNSIRGNSIFSNVGLGIDLGPGGVTANDLSDADTGANNLQNFPLLTSVMSNGGGTSIQGTLNSKPNTTFQIDFYSNAACDPSGNGEGARFFDTTSVTTDANGNAAINLASSVTLASGRVLTATATDPAGNTSEFSPCDSTNTAGSLQFSSASYYVLEDVGNAVITVTRAGGTKGTLSINYSTADGTAVAGSDYTAVAGTLVFADGETSHTFTIPIANDLVSEPDETVNLSLSGPTDLEVIGAPARAIMTIQSNSTPLLLIPNGIDVPEGNSGTTDALVTIRLTAQTGRTVTADFNTASFSATSGVDFVAASGSIAFAPATTTQTITVSVIGDTLNEFNETFFVVLSNVTNASVFDSASVRIIDDDPARIDSVTPAAGRISGGQQIKLTGGFAHLSTVKIGGISASWFFTNGSPDPSAITVLTPAHAVGAVQIDLTQTWGSIYSKANAFAYLPTVFTDNTIVVGTTTAKAQHIIELRQVVDALRAVAGLSPAPWTDGTLTPNSSIIKAIHIQELRMYLDDAATRLGYSTSPYTDPSLGPGYPVKRVHIEELRQRIRTIAG